MAADTLLIGKLDRFNYNLSMLHQTVELTRPVLEGLKNVVAVQWFLGNLFLITFFTATMIYLVLYSQKVKKVLPSFKLPRIYLITYSVLFIVSMFAFNFLPQTGMERSRAGLIEKTNDR